jgi:hypothetical protein
MLLKKVCTEFAIFEADDDPNNEFNKILPKGPINEIRQSEQVIN